MFEIASDGILFYKVSTSILLLISNFLLISSPLIQRFGKPLVFLLITENWMIVNTTKILCFLLFESCHIRWFFSIARQRRSEVWLQTTYKAWKLSPKDERYFYSKVKVISENESERSLPLKKTSIGQKPFLIREQTCGMASQVNLSRQPL